MDPHRDTAVPIRTYSTSCIPKVTSSTMQENLFGGLRQTGDFPSLCACPCCSLTAQGRRLLSHHQKSWQKSLSLHFLKRSFNCFSSHFLLFKDAKSIFPYQA